MTHQAIEGTFICEGLKQMRLFIPTQTQFVHIFIIWVGMLPTCSTWAHFSDAYSLIFIVRIDLSWSFLRFGISGPFSCFRYSYFRVIPFLKWLFCFVVSCFVLYSWGHCVWMRHQPSFVESYCFDDLILVNEISLLIPRGLVACSFYFALVVLVTT